MKMVWVMPLLIFAVMATGVALVITQYEARTTFVAIEKAKNEEKKLEQEWQRINTQTRLRASDVPVIARGVLKMDSVRVGLTQYVTIPDVELEPEIAQVSGIMQTEDPLEKGNSFSRVLSVAPMTASRVQEEAP